MRGTGKSMGHSQPQPRPSTGRKTLRSCRSKKETEDVVVIDIESDSFRNVIYIDVPESSSKKVKGSDSRVSRDDKRCTLKTVIYIDDDESTEDDLNGKGINTDGNFTGASSSNRCTTSYHFVDEVGDECQFVPENISPVKLSKCRRTYSRKVSNRNRYGLTSDDEYVSDSSDDDEFDCEFMESSFAQWEKAFLKRKNNAGKEDQASTSKSFNNVIHQETEIRSKASTSSFEKGDQFGCPEADVIFENGDGKFNNIIHQETEIRSKASTSSLEKGDQFGRPEADVIFENDDGIFQKEEQCSSQKPSSSPPPPTRSSTNEQSNHFDHADISNQNKQKTPEKDPVLSCSEQDENSSFQNAQPSSAAVNDHDVGLYEKLAQSVKEILSEVEKDHQEQEESAPEDLPFCKDSINEAEFQHGPPCFAEENDVSTANGDDAAEDHLHAQDGEDTTDCVENSIITDREKMKETDEYKRAVEEEWASRQRELQIQAEEAQHLRLMLKRRKAETMRILDMERRQKQRIEEIRETQKKDEENMNLKDKLRAEVREELYILEVMCTDMASLLRGLGIAVNGGLHPQSQEVRVAYKKALLNFHPDRASQSDIRQQVEAEEKFKLISRMKDKFLTTS